jgi:hypothetical protein
MMLRVEHSAQGTFDLLEGEIAENCCNATHSDFDSLLI